jgi:urease accessory protein
MPTSNPPDHVSRALLTVGKVLPQGRGLSAVLQRRAASVELDWDVRQKSRFDAIDSQGRTLGVFLPRGQVVRGGDILVAEDGSLIRVVARAQPVMVVRACAEHGAPFDLLRAAYHLGNRHVALQLAADHLKLEPDHVLAGLLRRMHMIVTEANEAFEPEGGAYAAAGEGHDHDHAGHEHEHEHGHDHEHSDPAQAHDHAHAHAHDAEHDHDHDHPHQHGQAHGETHEPVPGATPAKPEPGR